MMYKHCCLLFCSIMLATVSQVLAQNPIIRTQYSADPSARVFGDKVYLFPSHDILAKEGKGRVGWFCMEDYHVFSSTNLTDWTDHGMIVSQTATPWTKQDAYSMWAPDCIEHNGKYYFYFPAVPKDTTIAKGFTVGVAIADKPEGPYIPHPSPIKGVRGIDPNVFIDKNGQAYLYWSNGNSTGGNIYCAKLKGNMVELDSEVKTFDELPKKGLKEGPYMFERNGIYYLTYPHVENKIERLEYAISNNPFGPFKFTGVIMDESPTGCWTNHHSIVEFKNQWYLFYHHNDYSPNFDKARSVRVDSLTFNADGTIKKVIPTLRGVGVTLATSQIQIDRYTATSNKGVDIEPIDNTDRFKGWKVVFSEANAWVQYNSVDFSKNAFKSVLIKATSKAGSTLEIRSDSITGPILANVIVKPSSDWKMTSAKILHSVSNMQHLFIVAKDSKQVAIDWVSFQ